MSKWEEQFKKTLQTSIVQELCEVIKARAEIECLLKATSSEGKTKNFDSNVKEKYEILLEKERLTKERFVLEVFVPDMSESSEELIDAAELSELQATFKRAVEPGCRSETEVSHGTSNYSGNTERNR